MYIVLLKRDLPILTGNDKLSVMTSCSVMQLRIDMWSFSGGRRYAGYDSFSVAGERAQYKLNVGVYHGDAGMMAKL